MDLRFGSTDSIKINIGTYLSDRGIAVTDITEVIVVVKKDRSDEDLDSVALLTAGNGISLSTEGDFFFNFSSTDYGTGRLEAGNCYLFGIGFRTADTPTYLEPEIKDNTLNVSYDLIRA